MPSARELYDTLSKREEELHRERTSKGSMMGSITNELVKSYGFRRDSESGQWSWSLENIAKSFEEDPIWTTIDYLSLAAGPAKFGLAARGIVKGTKGGGIISKAYHAGEFAQKAPGGLAGREIKTWMGKVGERLGMSRELVQATEMKLAGPSRLHGVRVGSKRYGLANPITTRMDADWHKIVDRYGGAEALQEYEKAAYSASMQRERLLAEHALGRQAEDLGKAWSRSGLSYENQQRAFRGLAEGIEPTVAKGSFLENNQAALEAYENTWQFRASIHQAAYDTGLIDKKTYLKNLNKYMPRLYEEWEDVSRAMADLGGGTIPAKYAKESVESTGRKAAKEAVQTGEARFMKRAENPIEDFTEMWDPNTHILKLAKAGQHIARQQFAQRLSTSPIAQTGAAVGARIEELLKAGKVDELLAHGVTKDKIDGARRLVGSIDGVNREIVYEELARNLGWKSIDDLYGKRVPEYIRRLPEEFRGKLLDPGAVEELGGLFKALSGSKDGNMFGDFYKGAMNTFRASKTAYNPATWIRNIFGAAIFNHMATGSVLSMVPTRGLTASSEQITHAVKRGVLGSTFNLEFHKSLAEGADLTQRSALSWLGLGKFGDLVKKMATKAEDGYRSIDEAYKLDGWLRLTDKFKKRGYGAEEAMDLAKLELDKFTPQFTIHSQLTESVRQHVPFFSFQSEALRSWKNLMIEKPHMAFFYNHVAATMSQTFGAMAGFSPEQIEEAEKTLPDYMQGKKTLVLPFRVDGQAQFLDLSYLIPMGNIVETESEEQFFLTSIVNPTTNPAINMASAMATGKDAFTGREVAPNFTERQLGIPVEGPRMRKAVGLVEHAATLMVPPLAPPGYAGVNLLEMVRGQKNPQTGEALEPPGKAIAANLFGMRAYSPDVEAQIKNVKEEQRRIGERVSQSWDRWKWAYEHGDVDAMQKEQQRIIALKVLEGHDDPDGYFQQGLERRENRFTEYSTKQIEEILERSSQLGGRTEKDNRLIGEFMARLSERGSNRRGSREGRARPDRRRR